MRGRGRRTWLGFGRRRGSPGVSWACAARRGGSYWRRRWQRGDGSSNAWRRGACRGFGRGGSRLAPGVTGDGDGEHSLQEIEGRWGGARERKVA
jgi:hypothetical protein